MLESATVSALATPWMTTSACSKLIMSSTMRT